MSVISVENLKKAYTYHRKQPGLWGSVKAFVRRQMEHTVAVKGISFSVEEGEFVGFIGPNGAGKTTTLKMLSGVLYPTEGSATVLGFTPHERSHDYLQQLAFIVGQKGSLFRELPAMEMFLLVRDMYGIPDDRFRESLDILATLLDAKGFLDIQVRKLSMGQRMKCELMAGLLLKPVSEQVIISLRRINVPGSLQFILGLAIVVYSLRRLGVVPTVPGVLLAGVMVLAGLVTVYSLWYMSLTIEFWFAGMWSWSNFVPNIFQFARYPETVYTGGLRVVFLTVAPVIVVANFPTRALLGDLAWRSALYSVGLAGVLLALSRLQWRWAVRRYSSTGS